MRKIPACRAARLGWGRGWIRRGGRAGAAVPCDSGCPLPCLCVCVFIGGRTREQSSGVRLIGTGPVARGRPADPVRSGAVAVAMAPTRRRRPAKGKVGRRRSCVDFVAACLVTSECPVKILSPPFAWHLPSLSLLQGQGSRDTDSTVNNKLKRKVVQPNAREGGGERRAGGTRKD